MRNFKSFLEEKTLTPAEKKKREEIAKAIERDNPDMPMAKKMAIATATAKKVAEENLEEKGLWDNIWAKRRAGKKMRKPGSKGAPTDADFKRSQKESVELDELSPNTLHSYIKKAAGNMAGNAAVAAAQASSSMKKASPNVKRNIKNRMRGITGASGRLADKANSKYNQ